MKHNFAILSREKGLVPMDYLTVEFIVAIVMLGITLFLLFKVISQEIEEDIRDYKRRRRWHRWVKKRRKK